MVLRIGHIGAEYGKIGGIENYVSNLIENDSDAIVNSAIYVTHKSIETENSSKVFIKVSSSIFSHKLLCGTIACLYCKKNGFHAIHFHGFGVSIAAPFGRILGLKTIVHGHGVEWKRDKWGKISKAVLYLIEVISVTSAHLIFTVSDAQKQDIQKRFNRTAKFLPGGVDYSKIQTIQPTKDYTDFIYIAGRIVAEKRIIEILRSYESFRATDGNIPDLLLAGPIGNDAYSNIVREYFDRPGIRYVGALSFDQNIAYLKASSIFVQFSNLEGRSLAIIEALACGKICVLSNITENRELVSDLCAERNVVFAQDENDLPVALRKALSKEPSSINLTKISWVKIRELYTETILNDANAPT